MSCDFVPFTVTAVGRGEGTALGDEGAALGASVGRGVGVGGPATQQDADVDWPVLRVLLSTYPKPQEQGVGRPSPMHQKPAGHV